MVTCQHFLNVQQVLVHHKYVPMRKPNRNSFYGLDIKEIELMPFRNKKNYANFLHIVLNSDLKKTNIGQNTIMKITYGIKTDKNDNQYTKKMQECKKMR